MTVVRREDDILLDGGMPIEPARAAQLLLYLIAGLVVVTLVWAATASLDRVTRGQGRVISSNQLQEVQYFEGGFVKEILVREGDEVKAGDILIRLDPTQFSAEFTQNQDGYNQLYARVARLEASSGDKPLAFPAELERAAPGVVADESNIYHARMEELNAALEVETARLAQRRQSLEEARVAEEYARHALGLASEELALMRPLVEKGIEPQIELLRARQRESNARGEAQRSAIAVSRAEMEVQETESEIIRIRKGFRANIADELAKAKAEFTSLSGGLPALQDRVLRTEVKAPVDGVVNRVLVNTIGGVVPPGETVVEIVPSGDTLLVEAEIKPADIGFLRVGQDARVKITAYDSSVYGALDGHIEWISADAVRDEKKDERHYLIRVRTEKIALETRKGELQIMPGMAAEVDILNGKRTVLAYLLKPLAEVGDKALREQ